MEEVNFRLKVEADKAVSSVEKVNDEVEKTADNLGEAEKQGKALNKTTGKTPAALKKVSTGFKALGTAIKAAGIGLLVGVVAKLVDFFGNFREVTVEVEQAFAGLNVVLGRAVEAATALFKLDFSRFISSFDGVTEEINKVTKAVRDQFAAEDRLFQLRQVSIRQNAKLRVEQQNLLKTVEDTTLSSEKRIAASEKLEEVNQKLLKSQQDEIQAQKDIIQEQLKSEDNENARRDLILEFNRLKAQSIELEGAANEIERKSARQRRLIAEEDLKEQKAKEEKEQEELIAKREKELAELEANEQAKLEIFNRFKAARLAGVTATAKAEADAKAQEIAIEEEVQAQKKQLLTDTLGAVTQILGENSAAGKAAGIASALINTYQGVTQVLKAESVLPEPLATAQKVVSIGTTLATGFKAVQNIKNTKTPGGGGGETGGGPSAGASAQAAQQAQAPDFNIVGDAGNNEIASAVGNRNSRPQKSYVVSKEMTTQAELDRNIEEEASLG